MSVLDGKPAYPNSKTDFQSASRVTRDENGQLWVKNPYGGHAVAISSSEKPSQAMQSPYVNRAAYPRDYGDVYARIGSKPPSNQL